MFIAALGMLWQRYFLIQLDGGLGQPISNWEKPWDSAWGWVRRPIATKPPQRTNLQISKSKIKLKNKQIPQPSDFCKQLTQ